MKLEDESFLFVALQTYKTIINKGDRVMIKGLKFILVISVFIFGISIFSGCKENKTTDTYSQIKAKGEIIVGMDDTFVPMGFRDAKGNIVGFDVDFATEAAKRMGLKVKFQPIDWSMKESELNAGNIDLIWNGYTITDERKKKVSFTNYYLGNRQIIVTLAKTNINSKADLKSKKVGTQNGSSSLDAINKEPKIVASFSEGQPVLFDTNNEAFMDLEAGRCDAIVVDEILARYYIKQRGCEKYKVLNENFGEEEYSVGVRKNDVQLLSDLNKAMDDMKKDGTANEICQKWFGEKLIK